MGAAASPRKQPAAEAGQGKGKGRDVDSSASSVRRSSRKKPVDATSARASKMARIDEDGHSDDHANDVNDDDDDDDEIAAALTSSSSNRRVGSQLLHDGSYGTLERARRRAQIAKTSRTLKHRLALAAFKVGHGWESLTLDSLERQFPTSHLPSAGLAQSQSSLSLSSSSSLASVNASHSTTATSAIAGPAAAQSISTDADNKVNRVNGASAPSGARSTQMQMLNSLQPLTQQAQASSSSSSRPTSKHGITQASDSVLSLSGGSATLQAPTQLHAPGMQISPSAPADAQTAAFGQIAADSQQGSVAQGGDYIPYALPHLQQKANIAAATAAARQGQGQVPMSAPATVTAFSPPASVGGTPSRKHSVAATAGDDANAQPSPARKSRARRESAQAQTPSSKTSNGNSGSHRQRAATTATGASTPEGVESASAPTPVSASGSAHKRKPSQNTLWKNSRAILSSASVASASASAAAAAAANAKASAIPASPVKPSVLDAHPGPAATPSPGSRRQSAPVTNNPAYTHHAGPVQTPRRSMVAFGPAPGSGAGSVVYPAGIVPQSAPAHFYQYAPFASSNLNPSPVHPSLLQQQQQQLALMQSPAYGQQQMPAYAQQYTLATPQQVQAAYLQQPHTVQYIPQHGGTTALQEAQMHAQAAHFLQMTAPQTSGSAAPAYGQYAFSPPPSGLLPNGANSQMALSHSHSQAGSPASNAGSFVAPLAPASAQQVHGQETSATGRNRSRSGLSRTPSDLTASASGPPGLEHGQPGSSQDSSSLDTNLSLSAPVPSASGGRGRTITAPPALQIQTDLDSSANASAAELMLFLAHSPSPKAAHRKTTGPTGGLGSADLKGRRLFTAGSQEDLNSAQQQSAPMEQTFSAQQQHHTFLQAAPEGTYNHNQQGAEMHALQGGHLQQPFEYQYAMVGGPGNHDQGVEIAAGHDFGNW